MRTVDIRKAKVLLRRLVDEASAGEVIVLAKAGKPLACLGPMPVPRKRRRLGVLAGRFTVPDDFDAPLEVMKASMRKKLTRQGNRIVLVIDKPLLELLGLKAGSSVDVLTDGTSLLIRPVRSMSARRRAAFSRALAETNQAWGSVLQRLADR